MEQLDTQKLIETAKHYQVRGQHEDALRTYQDALATVSYTHLTLPTKRIV